MPAPCRRCVFWELGPKARPLGSEEAGIQKEAWLSSIVLEWGPAGHVLLVDGEPAGYSLYAPARFLEQASSQAARPVSRDAVLLATLAVAPEFEGQGIGRVLLQVMARDLIKRKVRAIEAFADRVWTGRNCHAPVQFLEACGFQVVREHPRSRHSGSRHRASRPSGRCPRPETPRARLLERPGPRVQLVVSATGEGYRAFVSADELGELRDEVAL